MFRRRKVFALRIRAQNDFTEWLASLQPLMRLPGFA
jgi:hypothetical protein